MPIADTKKAQTIVNLYYERVAVPILNAATVASIINGAIVGNNLEDEFTTNERNAFTAAVAALDTLAAMNGIANVASRYAPTHNCTALIITGVND